MTPDQRYISDRVIIESSGCWNWRLSTSNGYGQAFFRGTTFLAHRAAWLAFVGPLREDKQLNHTCGNRKCANPRHLFEADRKPPPAKAPVSINKDFILARVAIDASSGCWNWTAKVAAHGYGRHGHHYAHRSSYEAFVGPVPDGLNIDHLCRNRRCVNPAHLEPVTQLENVRRGDAGPKDFCVRGHQFTTDNISLRATGQRMCRACMHERAKDRFSASIDASVRAKLDALARRTGGNRSEVLRDLVNREYALTVETT